MRVQTRPTRVAVVTIVHGRHGHLRAQLDGLHRGSVQPDVLVVAAMDDPGVASVVAQSMQGWAGAVVVVDVEAGRWGLPLALARNRAAARAEACGADVLVFLDVDCIPGDHLLERYREEVVAAGRTPAVPSPRVLAGAVHYLAPPRSGAGYTRAELERSAPHPARPVPADESCVRASDVRLFWSLSFAVTVTDWHLVGGFDEAYEGYGGEDTDFALRVDDTGGELWWLGGAAAYHQYHPVADPPVQHLADIVRNANRFRRRWGWSPMEGWLQRFVDDGLVTPCGRPPTWHLTAAGHRAVRSG